MAVRLWGSLWDSFLATLACPALAHTVSSCLGEQGLLGPTCVFAFSQAGALVATEPRSPGRGWVSAPWLVV